MTDEASEPPHPASPDEAQASLRAELAGQIAAAQSELETQLAALQHAAGNSALTEELQSQLQVLHGLSQFLSTAHGASLYQIRAEVATSVAASRSISQQAQGVVTAAQAGEAADRMTELATARDDARRTTGDFLRDFYERRVFDPYLHFSSEADEHAYREREAERKQAIEDAKAENTPQGELKANGIALDQLNDAGEHGAKNSPDFQRRHDQLSASYKALSGMLKDDNGKAAEPSLPAPVDPSVLAALKSARVMLADQTQEGHGLSANASSETVLGRA